MNLIETSKSKLYDIINNYTELSDEAIKSLIEEIPVVSYKKGTILLNQGETPDISYYLIYGCVRQYVSTENGKESTVNFYTEDQSINMFSYADEKGNSLYSLSCVEECIMVTCPHSITENLDDTEPEFRNMLNVFFKQQFIDLQKSLSNFKVQNPEERFLDFIKNRSDLIGRVPQHILASYLDITPETFSRFKKRFLD